MLPVKNIQSTLNALFFVAVVGASTLSCSRADFEPVTYLLPEGYTGPIYVVYGIQSGKEAERVDGRRIYRIPKDGILLTQYKVNEGWVGKADIRFFYQKDDEGKIAIPHKRSIQNIDANQTDRVYAVAGSIGQFDGPQPLDCKVAYQQHFIGEKSILGTMSMNVRLSEYLIDAGVTCADIKGKSR
mgnify:CR=1 FL=1